MGLACVFLGAVPSHVAYVSSNDGNLWDLWHFSVILGAALVCFIVFSVCRLIRGIGKGMRLLLGTVINYALLLLGLFAMAWIDGVIYEIGMWLPVIVIFGIPFFAPTVLMSWFGCKIWFGSDQFVN